MTTTTDQSGAHGALHHVGIAVPTAQYPSLVGRLRRLFRGDVLDSGEDDQLDITWSWVAGPGGLIVEVVAPRSSTQTAITRFIARTGGGLHHLSFETDDIGRCADLLHQQGAVTVGHQENHGGWAEFFLAPDDVGGARLHWMQQA